MAIGRGKTYIGINSNHCASHLIKPHIYKEKGKWVYSCLYTSTYNPQAIKAARFCNRMNKKEAKLNK